MSSSDLSDLSSPLSTDEELANAPIRPGSLEHYFKNAAGKVRQASPPTKRKRPPSPPHEYVLADNPDIAVSSLPGRDDLFYETRDAQRWRVANAFAVQFMVMFRSRFSDAFPKSLPHYGPQDIERGVVEALPGEQVERLLCALIGLVLNRKKDVKYVLLHLRKDRHCADANSNVGEGIMDVRSKKLYTPMRVNGRLHGMVGTRSTEGEISITWVLRSAYASMLAIRGLLLLTNS